MREIVSIPDQIQQKIVNRFYQLYSDVDFDVTQYCMDHYKYFQYMFEKVSKNNNNWTEISYYDILNNVFEGKSYLMARVSCNFEKWNVIVAKRTINNNKSKCRYYNSQYKFDDKIFNEVK